MATNRSSIINDLQDSLLSTYPRANIADYITHEACKQYYNLYNKRNVPLSFIRFIFNEFKNYSHYANKDIKQFFKLYTDNDLQMIIFNYQKDQFSVITGQRAKKDDIYYHLLNSNSIKIDFADNDIYGLTDPTLYRALHKISEHISHNDELLTKQELYEHYMLREVLKTKKSNAKVTKVTTEKAISPVGKATGDKTNTSPEAKLSGKTIDIPKQSGKIGKLFFPKLNLPTTYPVSQTISRITVKVRLSGFMKTDKQLTLINRYQFNGVKYSEEFIKKRKAAITPQRKKFNFDF